MKSSWLIREATTCDADGLTACMQSAYGVYRERTGGARLPPLDVDYLSEILNYPVWVVDANGDILGGLIMSFDGGRASIGFSSMYR